MPSDPNEVTWKTDDLLISRASYKNLRLVVYYRHGEYRSFAENTDYTFWEGSIFNAVGVELARVYGRTDEIARTRAVGFVDKKGEFANG